MPLFKKWEEEGATWGIWKVSESPEDLLAMLTTESIDYAELEQYKCASRRVEYLAARVLLKELTGKELKIAHLPSGKPFLPSSSFNVTVSHTKGYVALGIHPCKDVGIDIEQVSERVLKVCSRFVRPDEAIGTPMLSDEKRLHKLLLIWSAKETMFKVLNEAGVDFLEHLQVVEFVPQLSGTFKGQEYRTSSLSNFAIHYLVHPEFVLTYLTTGKK